MIRLSWLLLALGGALAFPDGAPYIACGDRMNLRPSHSLSEFRNAMESDYRLVQDQTTFGPSDVVTVQLSTKGATFKGFIVKAVDKLGNETGHFLPGDLYQALEKCACATHVSAKEKTLVTMGWQAPASTSGEVHFLATVVYNYTTIYTGFVSQVAPIPVSPEMTVG